MQIKLLEKISEGNLSEAYLGRVDTAQGPRLLTVRRLLHQVAGIEEVIQRLTEASSQAREVNHENLLKHLGFGQAGDDYFWVDERPEGFDLGAVLNRLSSREVRINPLRSLQIGLDFTRGLGALHQNGIVFGGLVPEYILVGYDGVSRLSGAGFEFALMGVKELKQKSRRGRSEHLAPEVAQGRSPTVQSDVFSAAAIVYTLLTGKPPLGKEERAGMGMSVRHATVQPPSKLDRTLPFSCDAVFVKALNTSASGRHDEGTSLSNAIKRLRAAMLKGPDRGHQEVAEFIETLIPNEAFVAGMRGTLEQSAVTDTIELDIAGDLSTGPVAVQPANGETGAVVTPGDEKDETDPEIEAEAVDPEAAARVAAWEAAMGNPMGKESKAESPAAKPPPLPGAQKPPPTDKASAKSGSPEDPSSVVVVDWTGLDDEEQKTEDTDEVRVVRPDKKTTPTLPVPGPIEDTEPKAAIDPVSPTLEIGDEEDTPTGLDGPPSEDTDEIQVADPGGKAPQPGDTQPKIKLPSEDEIKQAAPTQVTKLPSEEPPPSPAKSPLPVWARPPALVALSLMLLVLIGLIWMISRGLSSGEEGPAKEDEPVTHLGFLTVQTDTPAQVTLDGELLPGTTPLEKRVLRAGKHTLLLQALDGERLLDEAILVGPGEHRSIRLIARAVPVSPETKPDGTNNDQISPVPNRRKKRRKKTTRKRKRRTKTKR
jgi:serine/threonine protein kinase